MSHLETQEFTPAILFCLYHTWFTPELNVRLFQDREPIRLLETSRSLSEYIIYLSQIITIIIGWPKSLYSQRSLYSKASRLHDNMQQINAGYKILIFSDKLWHLASSFIATIHYCNHKLHITNNYKQTKTACFFHLLKELLQL